MERSKRVLNEVEASKLPDIEFKIVVGRKLNKLCENYKVLQGTYNDLTVNYISMKKDIGSIDKSEEEIKNTISELENTAEGSKSSLVEAEY